MIPINPFFKVTDGKVWGLLEGKKEILLEADAAHFQLLTHGFGHDGRHVYHVSGRVPVQLGNFTILSPHYIQDPQQTFYVDKRGCYRLEEGIPLDFLSSAAFQRDLHGVHLRGQPRDRVKGADPLTFSPLYDMEIGYDLFGFYYGRYRFTDNWEAVLQFLPEVNRRLSQPEFLSTANKKAQKTLQEYLGSFLAIKYGIRDLSKLSSWWQCYSQLLQEQPTRNVFVLNPACPIQRWKRALAYQEAVVDIEPDLYETSGDLGGLPREICHMTQLRHLKLRGQGLSFLPEDMARLRHLRYLDLSENGLKTLPESLGALPKLEKVLLNLNPVEKMRPDLAALPGLSLSSPRGQMQRVFYRQHFPEREAMYMQYMIAGLYHQLVDLARLEEILAMMWMGNDGERLAFTYPTLNHLLPMPDFQPGQEVVILGSDLLLSQEVIASMLEERGLRVSPTMGPNTDWAILCRRPGPPVKARFFSEKTFTTLDLAWEAMQQTPLQAEDKGPQLEDELHEALFDLLDSEDPENVSLGTLFMQTHGMEQMDLSTTLVHALAFTTKAEWRKAAEQEVRKHLHPGLGPWFSALRKTLQQNKITKEELSPYQEILARHLFQVEPLPRTELAFQLFLETQGRLRSLCLYHLVKHTKFWRHPEIVEEIPAEALQQLKIDLNDPGSRNGYFQLTSERGSMVHDGMIHPYKSWPAIFDTFKWIRHIQLNNNLLTEVQPTSPFLQLESLHLVNNLLTDFRPDPSLFPQLTFLDLRHNPLRVDKEILYKHWPQLTHLLV